MVRLRPELPGGMAVSNVPGPPKPLHTLGGPIERFVSVGHMKYAAGLNLTVWSYAGQLNVGLYTCAEAVPDLWRFADFVNESFEELRKAAARESARISSPGPFKSWAPPALLNGSRLLRPRQAPGAADCSARRCCQGVQFRSLVVMPSERSLR